MLSSAPVDTGKLIDTPINDDDSDMSTVLHSWSAGTNMLACWLLISIIVCGLFFNIVDAESVIFLATMLLQ